MEGSPLIRSTNGSQPSVANDGTAPVRAGVRLSADDTNSSDDSDWVIISQAMAVPANSQSRWQRRSLVAALQEGRAQLAAGLGYCSAMLGIAPATIQADRAEDIIAAALAELSQQPGDVDSAVRADALRLARALDVNAIADITPKELLNRFDHCQAVMTQGSPPDQAALYALGSCLFHLPSTGSVDAARRVTNGIALLRHASTAETAKFGGSIPTGYEPAQYAHNGTAFFLTSLVYYAKRCLRNPSTVRNDIKKLAVEQGCDPDLIRPEGPLGWAPKRKVMVHTLDTVPQADIIHQARPTPAIVTLAASPAAAPSMPLPSLGQATDEMPVMDQLRRLLAASANAQLPSPVRPSGLSNRIRTMARRTGEATDAVFCASVRKTARPIILQELQRRTGRQVRLGGLDVRRNDRQRLELVATDIAIANPVGLPVGDTIAIDRAVIELELAENALTALNNGRKNLKSVEVDGVRVNLARYDAGPNWVFDAPPAKNPTPSAPFVLRDITLHADLDGQVLDVSVPQIRGAHDKHDCLKAEGSWTTADMAGALRIETGVLTSPTPSIDVLLHNHMNVAWGGVRLDRANLHRNTDGLVTLQVSGDALGRPYETTVMLRDLAPESIGEPLRFDLDGSLAGAPLRLHGRLPMSLLAQHSVRADSIAMQCQDDGWAVQSEGLLSGQPYTLQGSVRQPGQGLHLALDASVGGDQAALYGVVPSGLVTMSDLFRKFGVGMP